MSPTGSPTLEPIGPRGRCHGVTPLTARLEPWSRELCADPARLVAWLDRHGSPLNVLDVSPMARNAAELTRAADGFGVDLKIFFARKANKALAFVDEALRLGLGVDVASERELRQTLDRGVPPARIVVTAAVKARGLLELCAASRPTLVIDNEDELDALSSIAPARGPALPIALRLAPAGRRESRFGLGVSELLAVVERRWPAGPEVPAGSDGTLRIEGVHFHLDGYDPAERVAALGESFALVDALRARGHEPRFVDFGGGIPITYLDDRGEWERFWEEHAAALLGERPPLTFDGHGLGLSAHAGEIIGRPNVYPFHQDPTRAGWLAEVLGATLNPPTGRHGTVAAVARESGLELRCEPGRALMDGCGLTAARVEFRKRRRDGTSLIGLAMNRTQCRSTSDDFLVDPLLLRPTPADGSAPAHGGPAVEGFLVGAYCIERELLIWRRLRFPEGVEVGDVVVFPNTAGYLMHILESASHQIPLARNLVLRSPAGSLLDPIDAVSR